MRTLFLLLLLLVCLFPSSRSHATELMGCRTQFVHPNHQLSLFQQIRLDLLSGNWVQEHKINGNTVVQGTLLRFVDESKAQLLQYKANEAQTFFSFNWEINIQHEDPILLLTDTKTGSQRAFDLEQTCKGIELTDKMTNEVIDLDHQPFLSPTRLNGLQSELLGIWKNTFYPVETITANTNKDFGQASEPTFLKYEFKSDGSYFKSIKGTKVAIKENGRWELSKDGSTLIFNYYENGQARTYSARIKHLQMDELVLEHNLKAKALSLCTGLKSFYFNKQY